MWNSKKQTFNNKTYDSFTDLCTNFGLSEGCVRARLKRGWSIKEALGIIYRKNDSGGTDKKIEVNGIKYKSIKIACKSLKVKNYDKVYQRLKNKNYTVEQAFGLKHPPKKKSSTAIKITIGGKKFESKRAAAIFHKIDERIISNRIKRGWTIEEAYGLKNRSPDKNKIFFKNGKKKQGYIYIISNKFNEKLYVGITIGSIKERFNSHLYVANKQSNKDSLEYAIWTHGSDQFTYKKLRKEAVDKLGFLERFYIKKLETKIPNGYNINSGGAGVFGGINYKIPIIIEDEIFFSLSDVARYLGVNVATISARIRSGWSIKSAITKKIRSIKKIKFNSIEYDSINHAARALGLKVSTVTERIKAGWTLDKALKKKVKNKKNIDILPYYFNKKKFDNFADLARSVGIKPSTFTARLRAGIRINKALEIEVKSKKIVIDGKEFKNFKEATKHFNVDYNLALQRINRDKFSIKKALETN